MSEQQMTYVALAKLHPSPTNPRQHFNAERITEMAESMKTVGVISPIVVRTHPSKKSQYEIVAGETRWRAATQAQLDTVPVIVKELTDAQVLKIQVIENLQRDGLHPLEEANGFKRLLDISQDLVGYSIDDLAAEVGKSRTYIYDSLKLLELPEHAIKMFYSGDLNRSSALIVARLEPDQQNEVLETINDQLAEETPLSVRDIKELADQIVQTSAQAKAAAVELERAREIARELEAEGKTAILLETKALQDKWARWGFNSLMYNSNAGYTTKERQVVTPAGYANTSIGQILTEDELPGKVYLVNPQGEIAMVFEEQPAMKLVQEKLERGEIDLKPQPKSEWELKREAKDKESERRIKIWKQITTAIQYGAVEYDRKTFTLSLIRFACIAIIKSHDIDLKELMISWGWPEGTGAYDVDKFAERQALVTNPDAALNTLSALLLFIGTEPEWVWPEDADDQSSWIMLKDMAKFFGIDPDSDDPQLPSTPPTAALATAHSESETPSAQGAGETQKESPTGDELSGDLSVAEKAMATARDIKNTTEAPPAFQKIKADTVARLERRKKRQGSAQEAAA